MAASPSPRGETSLRLFVAITLPEAWKQYLAARTLQLERIAPGYTRWVAPELLHLTLLFLGSQPAGRLALIEEAVALAAAERAPFTLALGRLGHFGADAPRVLWMEALADNDSLRALHGALRKRLAEREIAFDPKPLVPHLTLGRARREAAPAVGRLLARRLATLALPPPPAPFTVETIALMRSELMAPGPRYTVLGEYPLGQPPP
ncbi:MAG TPA: RNA 2',3'-cyclic phosphodiesterase [Chloroflexota bacterium]|nr:RNA 2',3'-cyclic phosphodiesterase [Chloroflexota bacterium]